MAKRYKPVPKTQEEISRKFQQPYDQERGNPNFSPNPNDSETGIPFNRGNKLSFKGDKVKPFKISLLDIDEAIFYYFENVIKPYIDQNGNRIKVPIIYATPEKWKSFRTDGFYRDKKGSIMLPLITVKRNTITKNRSIYNKLDSNSPLLNGTFQKRYSDKNFYDNFSILNNRIPVKQYYNVVVPDYVDIEYDCIMQTYYLEQLNGLIEAIEYASDSYWGEPERFKFKTRINTFSSDVEVSPDGERFAISRFSINVKGYLIPETVQKDLTSPKKYNSKAKLIIELETTSNEDIFNSNIQKLNDGRTREERSIDGRISSLGEVEPGREVKTVEPNQQIRE